MGAKAGNQNASKRWRARSDEAREKIRVTQLINRLQNHADGEIEMTPTQIDAAKFLINKAVSNPPIVSEISGPDGDGIPVEAKVTFVSASKPAA